MTGVYREIADDGMFSAIRARRSSLIALLAKVSRFPRHRRVFNAIRQTVMGQIVGGEEKLTLILRLLHCAHPVLDLVWLLRDTMVCLAAKPNSASMREHDDLKITQHEPQW